MKSNPQQLEAIEATDRTIMCLAGAGAGKSFVLVHRIARLINEGVPASSILALTFTNAAAFEMKEKYKRVENIDLSKGIPEFRTFHGFCYSLIIKDKAIRDILGYTRVPEICDDKGYKLLQAEAKLQTHCTLSEAELANPAAITNAKKKFELEVYQKALKKLIRAKNLITFDMLCYNVCELFEKNNPSVEKYKQKYRYIMIDEMQDTDPRQFKFAASFPATTSMFFVGDALQSIYQFRGCTNKYIKLLASDPNWKLIKMPLNYRSTKPICEFANKFSTYAKPDYRIEMVGQRDGDKVEVITGSRSGYNNPVDYNHLNMLIDRLKNSEEETAVLCRTNKEVNYICDELKRNDITFTRSNKSTDTLDILNSSLDNQYMLEWLATFLDGKEYADYIRLASQQENPDIRWFLNTYGGHAKIQANGKKIIDIRKIMKDEISDKDKFDQITKLLKIKSKCDFDDSAKFSNKELVENIRDQIEEQEETKLYVGTIHSSKGLEYDTVYIMGVNDGMFELGTEEMNNLYYVAITRAKNHLTVFKY